jgi:hypothetical protein
MYMSDKNKIYGPELILEQRSQFHLRKFKRELSYCKIEIFRNYLYFLVYLIYSIPLVSYEIIREQMVYGHLNATRIIKQSGIILLTLGPLYAGFSSYFLYIPKERFWDNLSKKKNQYIPKDESEDPLKPKKPHKKIKLEPTLKEKL